MFQPAPGPHPSSSCRFKGPGLASDHCELLTHDQLRSFGLTNTSIRCGTSPAGPSPLHQQHTHEHDQSANNLQRSQAPPTPPSPPTLLSNTYDAPCPSSGLAPHLTTPPSGLVPHLTTPPPGLGPHLTTPPSRVVPGLVTPPPGLVPHLTTPPSGLDPHLTTPPATCASGSSSW